MKIICLLAFGLTLCFLSSVAQLKNSTPLQQSENKCATAEVLEKYIKSHPGAETTEQFENWISQKIAEIKSNKNANKITPAVTLPVIFHVIHDNELVGTGRNVSQAALQQQVLQINKDFANLSNSPYAVSEDMGIQFALAQNDPTGVPLAEPGINRINRNAKGWVASPYTVGYTSSSNNYLTNTIKPNSIWDPTRYLNIWIAELEANIGGIATFPVSSGLSGLGSGETNNTAGVAIAYFTVGSIFAPFGDCTDTHGKGRVLTHELGHFFWLTAHLGRCLLRY